MTTYLTTNQSVVLPPSTTFLQVEFLLLKNTKASIQDIDLITINNSFRNGYLNSNKRFVQFNLLSADLPFLSNCWAGEVLNSNFIVDVFGE